MRLAPLAVPSRCTRTRLAAEQRAGIALPAPTIGLTGRRFARAAVRALTLALTGTACRGLLPLRLLTPAVRLGLRLGPALALRFAL